MRQKLRVEFHLVEFLWTLIESFPRVLLSESKFLSSWAECYTQRCVMKWIPEIEWEFLEKKMTTTLIPFLKGNEKNIYLGPTPGFWLNRPRRPGPWSSTASRNSSSPPWPPFARKLHQKWRQTLRTELKASQLFPLIILYLETFLIYTKSLWNFFKITNRRVL